MRYYLDCEFNGMGGELLSLALVGEEMPSTGDLYLMNMNRDRDTTDPWVRQNVLPIMSSIPNSQEVCRAYSIPVESFGERISWFFGVAQDVDPIIVTDWPDDIKYFCQCMITGPGQMINIPGIKFEMHRVDAYPTTLPNAIQHNAYWDAMALRHKLQGDA